jgi:Nitrogen regulatory protein PII
MKLQAGSTKLLSNGSRKNNNQVGGFFYAVGGNRNNRFQISDFNLDYYEGQKVEDDLLRENIMKKIEAFIRHEKFDETKDALEGQGYTGMSVCAPHQTLIYSNYIYRSI